MPILAAEEKKGLGNAAFKAGDYTKAIEHYSEAIKLDPTAHTYWSNRSASYAGLNDWENAANDAAECIKADKNFVKGYFRLALAQKNLQRYEAALETITRGLGVDFGNNDLKGMRKEVEDGVRMQKVATIIETATKQFGAKDYSGALGTIEQGLRIDAGNSSLVALKAKVQPLWDKEEKTRKAGLSPVEKMKEEGDTMYKNASFEKAIQQYSKTLDKIDDKGSEIALKVYSNRAACYKQLSNFDGVISDCTSVLEVRPDDVKSLLRRAQAFEAVERYKMALQDVRTLLALPADQVGPSNTTIANGLQHRLNRVIQKLRDVPRSTKMVDRLQRCLDFDLPVAQHNPSFSTTKGLGRVGLAGFLLGAVWGGHLMALGLAFWTPGQLWLVRWALYVTSLALFHFMEFLSTALYKPETVTYDSFVINHSKEYTMAALAAWGEFWLELWLLPGLKTRGSFTLLLGGLLLVGGQACRIVAMHTARSHFSHTIMEQRAEGHQLVTHGIYAVLRHPSYCGWFWWVVGTQLVLCNPLCVVAYTLVSWRFFQARIKYEEGTLLSFYPQLYPAYRTRTSSGIPFIP